MREISIPVLVLGTFGDRLVSPAAIPRAAARIPNSTLKMFDTSVAHEILRERDGPRDEAIALIDALLDKIKAGEAEYHFVEVMACPGGCVNGGGQPIQPASVRFDLDLRAERAKALYEEDQGSTMRRSHQNPRVLKMYEEYFEKPGGHKSHKLLHTHYVARENYPENLE